MKAEVDENLKNLITDWAFRKEREFYPTSFLENPALPEWLLSKITSVEKFRSQTIDDAKLYWEISLPFGFGMQLFFPDNIEIESFLNWRETIQNYKAEMEYCERMDGMTCDRYDVKIKRLGYENGEWKIIEIFNPKEREQMKKFVAFMKDFHSRKAKES